MGYEVALLFFFVSYIQFQEIYFLQFLNESQTWKIYMKSMFENQIQFHKICGPIRVNSRR